MDADSRAQTATQHIQAQVEEAEARRIHELAGMDLKAALRDARQQQAGNNKALETAEADITEVSQQLNRYAEGLDPSFAEAVDVSAQFLEHDSYQQLTPEDIQQVAKTYFDKNNRTVLTLRYGGEG